MRQILLAVVVSLCMMMGSILLMPFGTENADADTWIQSTDTDFSSGTLANVEVIGTGENARVQLETSNELGVWQRQHMIPPALRCFAMAYDSKNNKVVLFGGRIPTMEIDETWVYDTASDVWTRKNATTRPSPRRGHAMTYDSENNKIVLFGGTSVPDGHNAETWIYDTASNTWTQQNPSTSPSARERHTMAYDSRNNRVVLFGGNDGTDDDETWIYDTASDTWTQQSPPSSPSARLYHSMAYDSSSNEVVLFGGQVSSVANDETWVYDVASDTWTQQSPSTSPPARYLHRMEYDSANDKVVLFGGNDGSRDDGTWLYDTATDTWTQQNPPSSPSARERHKMAYDSANNKIVLYGGYDGLWDDETWVYDTASDRWTQKNPTASPSARKGHSMVYDNANNKVLLFGGSDGSPDAETWVYETASDAWTQQSPPTSPSARENHDTAYDSANKRMVLFGGNDGTYDSETWAYDFTSDNWVQKSPSVNPSARYHHAMTYDSVTNKVVLFGGEDAVGLDAETWVYDLSSDAWTQMAPSASPSARSGHSMVYDPISRKVVLFGGNDGGCDDETWVYDVTSDNWTQRNPSASPKGRDNHSMVYDSGINRIVLFGGKDSVGSYNDTWLYDPSADTWTQKNPTTRPSERYGLSLVYDSSNNNMVLFGGNDGNLDDETWVFNPECYYSAGVYTSKIYSENNYRWHRITWAIDTEPDGFVRFQVAVNNHGRTWNYLGPDGSPSTYYDEVTGCNLFDGYSGKYLRYKAYLTTHYAGSPPKLLETSIISITEAPMIRVSSPNGGEDWIENAYYPIIWTAEGDFNSTPVCLHYSADNGVSWTSIVNWTADTGHYNWTVPNIETANALIRVSISDVYGFTVSDTSDASFAIDPPPQFSHSISSPAANVIWGMGEHSILWSLDGSPSHVSLEYTLNGENWTEIGADLPNTNSYTWNIPEGINSMNARIRLKAQDQLDNVQTLHSGIFTIDTEPPVIVHDPAGKGMVDSIIYFEATVDDNYQLTSVTLFCNDGSGFVPTAMTGGGSVYRGSTVPTVVGSMEYYITASDGANYVSTDVITVEIQPPEKNEPLEDEAASPYLGIALSSGIIAGIVMGLALRGYLTRKED